MSQGVVLLLVCLLVCMHPHVNCMVHTNYMSKCIDRLHRLGSTGDSKEKPSFIDG